MKSGVPFNSPGGQSKGVNVTESPQRFAGIYLYPTGLNYAAGRPEASKSFLLFDLRRTPGAHEKRPFRAFLLAQRLLHREAVPM